MCLIIEKYNSINKMIQARTNRFSSPTLVFVVIHLAYSYCIEFDFPALLTLLPGTSVSLGGLD